MADLRSELFLWVKVERLVLEDTWSWIVQTQSLGRLWDSRKVLTSLVSRTSSTLYILRASAGESGSPDHITSSGSIGGIKRVKWVVSML